MRFAVVRAMTWALLHDRGALAMAFLLPPIVFMIFAAIFSGTTSGDIALSVALSDARQSRESKRLVQALERGEVATLTLQVLASEHDVADAVRNGSADVGVVIRDNGTRFGDLVKPKAPAPVVVVADPTREIAVATLTGALQAAYFDALPDVVLRGVAEVIDTRIFKFQPEQHTSLERGLEAIARLSERGKSLPVAQLVERRDVLVAKDAPLDVTYYAGAVAILFLLFAASHAAITLIEERESGVLQRLARGPAGSGVVVDGKFVFITCQGLAQVVCIYLVAWLVYDVPVLARFWPWLLTSALAAASAAGLTLAFASFCRSKAQAQSLGNFVILIMSAIGGSMVPRYLMPDVFQSRGWLTPNTWTLEAYGAVFWRTAGSGALFAAWGALALTAALGLAVARVATRRQLAKLDR